MSWIDKLPLPRFLNWLRGVLSEPDGTPSSTRVLLFAFSIFSMWLVWRCFYHIFQLHDATQVSIWLANMPLLIASLMGLIALPYGINKGSSTFSDIANIVTASKNKNGNDIQATISSALAPPTPPKLPTTPATGTPGVAKG